MSRKAKLLIVLLTALLVSDVGLVTMNLMTARDSMLAAQQDRLRALRDGFDIALYSAETKLTEIAAFVTQIDEVKAAMRQAKAALSRNHGDSRAPEVEQARRGLAAVLGQRWTRLQFNYMLRQFGFYLGTENTAFYRAEAPHLYGDAADPAQSLVSVAAATRRPAAGFDIDSLSTGVRAALPIDPAEQLGVIEIGSSFDAMLIPICPNSHCGVTVLLNQEIAGGRMGRAALDATFTNDRRVGDWLVESSTNPALTRALLTGREDLASRRPEGELMQIGRHWYAVASFPLSDHLGKDDPDRVAPGRVLIWQDVNAAAQALEAAQTRNIAVAIAAFLLIALLIYLMVELVTAKLETEVRRRTAEVQSLLEEVSFLAERDPLTGLYNRRIFTQRLHQEIARARRNGESFSLVSIDLDFFKKINDLHGHPTGDQALCQMGTVIRENVRLEDIPARVGGEEFSLLLPQTDLDGAVALTQRLKDAINNMPISTPGGTDITVTFSAGVTTWRHGAEEEQLLREVDQALYHAKATGRNRVVAAALVEAA